MSAQSPDRTYNNIVFGPAFTTWQSRLTHDPVKMPRSLKPSPPSKGWMPIEVHVDARGLVVDWCDLGSRRFIAPFFEDTVRAALRDNPPRSLRWQTGMDALEALAAEPPDIAPSGFIFHLSRCGSTLVSQVLAASVRNIVISEPPPLDRILRPQPGDPAVTRDRRLRWFRGLVHAFGARRFAEEARLFIKFDSWHTLELPFVREAFPDVPWIFVHRDPVEVMVSHRRLRGRQMIPGGLTLPLLDLPTAAAATLPLDEYCARVLARICSAVLPHLRRGDGRAVDFRALPDAIWAQPGALFDVAYSDAERAAMRAAAKFDAKNPAQPHSADSVAKRCEASDAIRALAQTWLGEIHAELERLTTSPRPSSPRAASRSAIR